MRLYLLGKNSSGIQLYMEKKPSCRSPIFFYSILLSSFDFDAVMLSWEPTRAAEQIRIKLLLTLNSVWLMQFIRIFEPWHVIGVGSHTRVLEYQGNLLGPTPDGTLQIPEEIVWPRNRT